MARELNCIFKGGQIDSRFIKVFFGGRIMIREHEVPSSYVNKDDKVTAEAIDTLNGLIETCKDGTEGFKQAAEAVKRNDIKDVFMRYSQERAAYAADLQNLVTSLGGDPQNSGSFAGTMHRGWINIKTAIAGSEESAVLNECERGEDSAKKMYKEALEKDLPDFVRTTVQKQYEGVLAAHDHVKMLRDTFNNEKANTARSSVL